MKIVAVSDLHFDAVTAGVSRFDEVQRSFRAAVARACEWANLFVFAGDACDPDNGSASIRAIAELCRGAGVLKQAKVPSVWVAGNHDVIEDSLGTTVLDPVQAPFEYRDVYVATKPNWTTLDGGGSVLMLPYLEARRHDAYEEFWLQRNSFEFLAKQRPIIVVSHFTKIEGVTLGSESTHMARGRGVPLPVEELKKIAPDVILQGHFHKPGAYNVDGMKVHVIGSPEAFTFGEDGQRAKWLEIEVT